MIKTTIIKKNGNTEDFDMQKIINAVEKSASRCKVTVDEEFQSKLESIVENKLKDIDEISVSALHEIVQESLDCINSNVFKEYRSYRDYKKRYAKVFNNILETSKRVMFSGDKENANKNSLLVSTKKGIMVNELSKQVMLEYELPKESTRAHNDGDIYIHDLGDRFWKSINCCLFDMGNLLKDGFELNGVQYTEPTSAESFMRVFSDIVLEASSQQYGGFTVPELDSIGAPYIEKALIDSKAYYAKQLPNVSNEVLEQLANEYVERALEQGFQAVETRLNTISNSNTQTPFVTFTFGLDTTKAGRMINKAILKNRMKGIGKQKLTPVFPKLVFLNRYGVNGQPGDANYDIYEMAIECMQKRMYPDILSLNNGYLGDMYDEHELAISPMG